MILRRVIEHVKAQNWTAIFLDFVIVVVGVFIGVQAAGWKNEAANDRSFAEAHRRLIEETRANIDKAVVLQEEVSAAVPVVSAGVEALLACDATPEAEARVNEALRTAVITFGAKFDRNALDSMLGSDANLARLGAAERQRLADYSTRLANIQNELNFMEVKPTEHLSWTAPSVTFGPVTSTETDYIGMRFKYRMRAPALAVDMQTACRDNALVKNLRVWETYQLVAPSWAMIAETAMRENLAKLEERAP